MTRTRSAAVAVVLVFAATSACSRSSPSDDGATPGATTTVVASTAPSADSPTAFGPAVLLGELSDEAITESSGLAASRRNPGRLWTLNDSDNPPVVFCVEPDGAPCGGWTVDGADNLDWEDIAAGPGPQPGEHYLYVGDIGDNERVREDVVVYRVAEPTVPADSTTAGGVMAGGVTAAAAALRFRYEDGAHDAESLMVHPVTGDLYVVTKALGDTGVYRGPPAGGVLTRVGSLGLGLVGLATGADISPDGRRVALCTPFGGFEITAGGGPGTAFDAIWDRPAIPVSLPARDQGEAIAYRLDGNALLLTSEGYPSPLYEVPRL